MKGTGWVLAFLLAAAVPAQADVLLLDAISAAPPNSSDGVPRPKTGTSMAGVRAAFGEPTGIKDAIGDPPITRWIYPGYTVYFEYEHVINVVVHRE